MTLGFSPKQRAANRHISPTYHPGAAAGDATEDWAVFRAPAAGFLKRCSWVPNAAVTGAATNHFSIVFVNKGVTGAGVTTIGTAVTFASGTNATAYNEVNVSSADVAVAKDEVIAFRRTLVGTGLAAPEGCVVIEFSADDWA